MTDSLSAGPPGHAGQSWSVEASLPISYQVRQTPHLLNPDSDALERYAFNGPSNRRLIVIEQRLYHLYGARLLDYLRHRRLRGHLVCVNAEEADKDLDLSMRLIRAINDFGIDRRQEPLIVVGGGVILDVVGWVASIYRRGTPYIRIPTSLIAQVDAAVGIKTGVNHDNHKNRLGSYHPPLVSLVDTEFLATLPRRHVSNGLAEIAKLALIRDERLWRLLEAHSGQLVDSALGSRDHAVHEIGTEVMSRAIDGMLSELRTNLWEKNLQRPVDFGHTFSPAIEMAGLPDLLHGEAVAVDIALSCCIAEGRGLLTETALHRVLRTLTDLGLPIWHRTCEARLVHAGLAESVRHRGGRQLLPLPVAPGRHVFVDDVAPYELDRALYRLAGLHRAGTVTEPEVLCATGA
ncbi:sedoheptulose 7-phosphate cyclase [Actinoplanes sp. NPDC026670]|uniref:sedoheptulose 7-phosphate cyclase n=1 Tax=Actinoplanes sp. NPDC026670 TaxID=3154700 RepID=UPI003411653B